MDQKLKHIQHTLGKTQILMHENIKQYIERGESTTQLEYKSEELEELSFQFVIKVIPWYESLYLRAKRACCSPLHYCCIICRNCCAREDSYKRKKRITTIMI
jgi:hypothetical protein